MNEPQPQDSVVVSPPDEAFFAQLAAQSIALEPDEVERLRRYLEALYEANRRFNLTAIREPSEAWTRHIFDSLTLLPLLISAEVTSVADVGSGGGLPGLVLAIVLPDVRFTLIESTGKKARFLEDTAAALELGNVTVVNERAEVVGQDHQHHRDKYDAVLARAVGPLPVLLELTVPLAREGGFVFAIKGERAKEEIETAKQALYHLHAAVVDVQRTPTGSIVIIEKRRKTPRLYPRSPGEPKRRPLG